MCSFPCANCKKGCSAEFVGTYLLVLFGAGSVIISTFIQGIASILFVASIFGGTVALVILIFGKHSGAHINPAVTLAHTFARKTKKNLILPYLFFQALGGIIAALTLRLFFLNQSVMPADLGSTELAIGVTPIFGILLEAVGTFLLCSAALAATFYVRRPIKQAALVGGTLFTLILLIGHLTGASFNPARSIGPALSSGHWSNIFVYLIGPLLGAVFAGIPFRILRRSERSQNPICVS